MAAFGRFRRRKASPRRAKTRADGRALSALVYSSTAACQLPLEAASCAAALAACAASMSWEAAEEGGGKLAVSALRATRSKAHRLARILLGRVVDALRGNVGL